MIADQERALSNCAEETGTKLKKKLEKIKEGNFLHCSLSYTQKKKN